MALRIIWASPWTLLGLAIAFASVPWGNRLRRRGRVIECWGGPIAWLLRRVPIRGGAGAITLGHVVLGISTDLLDVARSHELVHVRQYELWGPLMGPAYLACCLVLLLSGKDPYRDNPFEKQAYAQARR